MEVPNRLGPNPAGTEQAILKVQRLVNAGQRFNLHYAVAEVDSIFNGYDSSYVTFQLPKRGFHRRTIYGTIRPSCPWAVSGTPVGIAYSSRVAVIFSPENLIFNDEGQIAGARVETVDPACVVEVMWMY